MPVTQRHRQCAIYTRPDVIPNDNGQMTIYVDFSDVPNKFIVILSEINRDNRGPSPDWTDAAERVQAAVQRKLAQYNCLGRLSATKYYEIEFDVDATGVDDAKQAISSMLYEYGIKTEIYTPA